MSLDCRYYCASTSSKPKKYVRFRKLWTGVNISGVLRWIVFHNVLVHVSSTPTSSIRVAGTMYGIKMESGATG